jgi:Conserved hypothetical ATP binding protein
MPGQVELYTSSSGSLKSILTQLERNLNFNFVVVHLIDSVQMFDRFKFLASLTLSLSAVMGMEMPLINFITKVDMLA